MENPRTALHIAAANDDVDGVCRLIEWGADVNIRDNKKYAAYLYANLSSCIKEPAKLDCCLWANSEAKPRDDCNERAISLV